MHFYERLKQLRKNANLTQNEFSERVGVHFQTVSKWATLLPKIEGNMAGNCVSLGRNVWLSNSEMADLRDMQILWD
jgi:hypothetical protein